MRFYRLMGSDFQILDGEKITHVPLPGPAFNLDFPALISHKDRLSGDSVPWYNISKERKGGPFL